MGFRRSPGLSGGCGVATWGHQCPKLEGGDRLLGPHSRGFSDLVSLATHPGPKRRRGHWPAGVFRLRSSSSVPPSTTKNLSLTPSDRTLLQSFWWDFLISLFIHHQSLLRWDVLQARWNVPIRPVWKSGRSVMAQMTAGTEQMSWTVVNNTNMRHIDFC